MKLPDDFWSVSEDEPGWGGVAIAGLVYVLVLVVIVGGMLLAWAGGTQ